SPARGRDRGVVACRGGKIPFRQASPRLIIPTVSEFQQQSHRFIQEFPMQSVKAIVANQLRTNLPDFRAGDKVKVFVKIKEGEKERVQIFEGMVIARRGGGLNET